MLNVPLTYSPAAYVIIGSAWNKIPEEYRKIIMEVSDEVAPQIVKSIRQEQDDAMEALKIAGIIFDNPPKEMIQKLKERTDLVYKNLVGSYIPQYVMDEVIQARDEYRAQQSQTETKK